MRASVRPFIDFDMVSVHKRPDDGSYLESKHVAVNKLIKKWCFI